MSGAVPFSSRGRGLGRSPSLRLFLLLETGSRHHTHPNVTLTLTYLIRVKAPSRAQERLAVLPWLVEGPATQYAPTKPSLDEWGN